MTFSLRLILHLALVFAGFAAAAEPISLGVRGEYRCGPGDKLAVTVFEVEELSGPVSIDADGLIRLPLIGAVAVGGLTTGQIEGRLVELYAANLLQDPQIAVAVEEFGSQPVSVLGAVKEPGVLQLQGTRRLLDVIAMAGGLSEQAGERILIQRPGADESAPPLEIAVPVKQMLGSGADSQYNPWIQPHDTIQAETAGLV